MPPTRNKLTKQAVAELMRTDLLDLDVTSIGDEAPAVRASAHACTSCVSSIVHTHAWTDPSDDR